MKKSVAVTGAVLVSFAIGVLISMNGSGAESERAYLPTDLPAAATQIWFPPLSDYDTGGEPLDDERFDALMASLDAAMTDEQTLSDMSRATKIHMWNFVRRLAVPRVTDEQWARVNGYLGELAERHPDYAEEILSNGFLVQRYSEPSPNVPLFSSAISGFTYQEAFNPAGDPFSDAQVDGLIGALASALEVPEAAADFGRESSGHFSLFANRLRKGLVSDEQHARIVEYFDKLRDRHPESVDAIDEALRRVASFTPGRVAPNIVGKDTDGVEFALEDYRGNIVVLIFSGEWCGPCIGEYPYHQFLLDQHPDAPLVLLGVNSDDEVETIRAAKASGKAPSYRTWWDGHAEVSTSGPIATEWGVTGWPAIYVIDEEGVIRDATNVRGGALIATVEKMLMERRMREYEARAAAGDSDEDGGEEQEN